jgi:hypothetical protein
LIKGSLRPALRVLTLDKGEGPLSGQVNRADGEEEPDSIILVLDLFMDSVTTIQLNSRLLVWAMPASGFSR